MGRNTNIENRTIAMTDVVYGRAVQGAVTVFTTETT